MHAFGNVPAVLIHIKMTTIFLTWCFYSYYYDRVTLTEERFWIWCVNSDNDVVCMV